jgi:hypothetical protein
LIGTATTVQPDDELVEVRGELERVLVGWPRPEHRPTPSHPPRSHLDELAPIEE